MGHLSDKNKAAAAEHARRITCRLIEDGYEVDRTTQMDLGGLIVIVVKNPDAVTYTQEQVRTGEAAELEAIRRA